MTENKLVQPNTALPKTKKVQTAYLYLSQVSTEVPTATVIENTIGEITVELNGVGDYELKSNGLFKYESTFIEDYGVASNGVRNLMNPPGGTVTLHTTAEPIDENTIAIKCYTAANTNTPRDLSDVNSRFYIRINVLNL